MFGPPEAQRLQHIDKIWSVKVSSLSFHRSHKIKMIFFLISLFMIEVLVSFTETIMKDLQSLKRLMKEKLSFQWET